MIGSSDHDNEGSEDSIGGDDSDLIHRHPSVGRPSRDRRANVKYASEEFIDLNTKRERCKSKVSKKPSVYQEERRISSYPGRERKRKTLGDDFLVGESGMIIVEEVVKLGEEDIEWDEKMVLEEKEGEEEDDDDDEPLVDLNSETCDLCFSTEGPSKESFLLMCDGPCLRSFHLECLGLTEVPDDANWLCHSCKNSLHLCGVCGILGKLGRKLSSKPKNAGNVVKCMIAGMTKCVNYINIHELMVLSYN
jgi:hypothetical protein